MAQATKPGVAHFLQKESYMSKEVTVTVTELVALAATRGVIGVGAGLLLANGLSRENRKAIGLPLFIAGVLSTIPIAFHIFGGNGHHEPDRLSGG